MSAGANSEAPRPTPRIVRNFDGVPHFGDRNVVFVSNLLALFFGNEAETEALRREVGEIDSYGGRLIPVIDLLYQGPGENRLLLERAPDDTLCRYFSDELGLSVPQIELLSHDDYLQFASGRMAEADEDDRRLDSLRSIDAAWMDGYVTDPALRGLAEASGKRTLSTEPASRFGNDKVLLYQHLERIGLPVFDTVLVEARAEIAAACRELASRGYAAAALRSAIGASGIGMMRIDFESFDADSGKQVPDHFFNAGPCLFQGWMEAGRNGIAAIRSPSVQLFLTDDRVELYDLTEQILSGDSVHEGNEAPPPWLDDDDGTGEALREELLRQAAEAANWLHAQGYRGTGSVDFIVAERAGSDSAEVYICEINARVTGATYPAVLARHCNPEGVWLLRNLRLSAPLSGRKLLEMLRGPRHLYQHGDHSGILPLNFNFGRDGLVHKGQFLCLAADRERSRDFLDLARLNLPVTMTSERD